MAETRNEPLQPHRLQLQDRKTLTVSGVSDVDSFDATVTVIYTVQGELTVKGDGLHILSLNSETGDLTLEGLVRELIYTDTRSRTEGLFGKLFR